MVARTRPKPKQTVTLTTAQYLIYCCADGHIHVDVLVPGADDPIQLSFDDTEAYEFAQAILRGYDVVNGIAPDQA